MARILLVGSQDLAQENLAATLRAREHHVFLSNFASLTVQKLQAPELSIDIVIFDVSEFTEGRESLVRSICRQSKT